MISGANEMVEIMGASPDVPGGPAAPPPATAALVPMHKPISTAEKIGIVGAVLLLLGGVAYSMSKKG